MRNCLIILLLLLSGSSFAQLRVLPLQGKAAPMAAQQKGAASAALSKTAGSRQVEVLELPFWDDFSYWGYFPDPDQWQGGSSNLVPRGATISYGVALNPTSWGVATFDGIRADGTPYNTTVSGPADTLQSAFINLSTLTEAEQAGVYLSFYWQLQGLGNRPDTRDSLYLYFLDHQKNWVKVWSKGPATEIAVDKFYQKLLSLKEEGNKRSTNFFHPDFSFMFLSYNSPGGQFDQWHLDYVYLNKDRSATDTTYRDVAISAAPPSLLSPYTTVPAHHFLNDPGAYLSENLTFTAFSFLPPGEEALYLYQVKVRTGANEELFSTESALVSTQTGKFIQGQQYFTEVPTENPSATHFQQLGLRDTLTLINTIKLQPDERFDSPALFYKNDEIEFRTRLSDQYGYDDGKADAAISLGNKGQRMAVRFTLPEQDTLTDVSFYFPHHYNNASNPALELKVWSTVAGIDGALKDELLYTQYITVPTIQAPLDSMIRFTLKNPLVVPAGEVFIGYEQLSEGQLALGFDLNTDSSPHIFQSIGTSDWTSFTYSQGSIMMRPHFANKVNPEALGGFPDHYFPGVKLYPNPTRDKLWVESEADFLSLYDSQGRLLLQTEAEARSLLELGQLQPGLYLLQLQYKKGVQSKRILIVR